MDRKLRNFKWMVGYSANYSIPDDVDEVPLNLQDAVVEKYMEFVLGMGSQTAPRELSFLAVDAPPYIFANRVSNETLAMYGPLFSVFMEMAKKLNYSTTGTNLESNSLVYNTAKFRPDVMLTTNWPQLSTLRELAVENEMPDIPATKWLGACNIKKLVRLSVSIGVLDIDHIVSPKVMPFKVWYSFLRVFSPDVWFLIALSILVFTFLIQCQGFYRKGPKLFESFWVMFTSLFTALETLKQPFGKLANQVLILWLVVTFVLQQYIGGEWLSEMISNPQPIVIDSLDDILGTDFQIFAMNPDVMERPNKYQQFLENYFPKGTEYHRDFTPRLTLKPLSELSNQNYSKFILERAKGSDKELALGIRLNMEYNFQNFLTEKLKAKFHISRLGGDAQPYFVQSTHFAEDVEHDTMNFVIRALVEAGIYDEIWLNTFIFGYKPIEEEKVLIAYQPLKLRNILGSLYLSLIFCSSSFVAFFFEIRHFLKRLLLHYSIEFFSKVILFVSSILQKCANKILS